MSGILQIAAGVGTPLALVGLVAALVYYAYTRRLQHEEAKLKLLPEKDRAKFADEFLTRYKIDGRDLSAKDKLGLIQKEMEHRHQRSSRLVLIAAILFVACFALAVAAYVLDGSAEAAAAKKQAEAVKQEADRKEAERRQKTAVLVAELNARAEGVLTTMREKQESLEADLKNATVEGEQRTSTETRLATLTESIRRFELLHKEYITSLEGDDPALSHERLGRTKEFLASPALVQVLAVTFMPHYSVRATLDTAGQPQSETSVAWTPTFNPFKAGKVMEGYFATMPPEVDAIAPDQFRESWNSLAIHREPELELIPITTPPVLDEPVEKVE